MSDPVFSKEQIAALEQILGVKLPAEGFTLEIQPLGSLDDAQLDKVVGGTGPTATPAPQPRPAPTAPGQLPNMRWSAKI